ncbi:beta-N-acetylhexosaminidase [Agreia sp.]|uniref:beta-N-acetylhexosaminidase n=1 Tax=Agreia sp. TaxID=1872416 RepID=UPI0035BC5D60
MTRQDILQTLLPGFVGTELPDWLRALLAEGLAGVCLFGENVSSGEQLRRLTADIRAANPAALIAIDEEGGDVTRLYADVGSPFAGNALLGRIDDETLTCAVGRRVGAELRAVGVNLDFAPDVDINSNSDNPVIGVRSFGAATDLVSRHGAAWTRGLQSQGVAAGIKHFPGHGDTSQDSHLALPVVDLAHQRLRGRELEPFRAAIEAGAATVMTSHILLPRVDAVNPATFSREILGGILRDELKFEGVIVSDALDMAGASAQTGIAVAAARALAAGCDLLCIGTRNTRSQLEDIVAEVDAALQRGDLEPARLSDAAGRVRALAHELRETRATLAAPGLEPDVDFPAYPSLADAFEVSPDAARFLAAASSPVVVRIDTEANIAVGNSPWGPFSSGLTLETVGLTASNPVDVRALDADRPVIVIGRDNHRHPWVTHMIDEVRGRHPAVVVVDMGWPGDDRRYADIATFGASRIVGLALRRMIDAACAAPVNGDSR